MKDNQNSLLIVDDTPDHLHFLSNLLTLQGYKVQRATSGQLALNAAFTSPPDLILLDIFMSEMNGYEVFQRLRANPITCDVPVIFLSNIEEASEQVKAFEIGGVDYINKPFRVEEVLARIKHQLTIQQLTKLLKQQNDQLQQEIESRKQAEKLLGQSQSLLGSVLDSSLDGIMAFKSLRDSQGNIADFEWLLVNPIAEKIVGRMACELLGKYLLQEMPGNRKAGLFDLYVQVVETGEALEHEFYYDYEGIKAWFQSIAVKLDDGFAVTFRNITQRKQADEGLKESEQRFRGIFENAAIAIGLTNADGKLIKANPSFENFLGYTEAEMCSPSFPNITHPDDQAADIALTQEVIDGVRNSFQIEKRYISKNGEIFWGRATVSAVRGSNGEFLFTVGMLEDINDRKLREIALKESERRFRAIFNNSFQFTGLLKPEGTVIEVNQTALDFCGIKHSDVAGLLFWEIDWWKEKVGELGSYFKAEGAGAQELESSAIQNSERDFGCQETDGLLAIEKTPQPCTPKFKARLLLPGDRLSFSHQEDLPALHPKIQNLEEQGCYVQTFTPFYKATALSPKQERLREAIQQAASGEFVRYEVEVSGVGGVVITLDFSLKPVFDETGRVVMLISEGRDITERKQAEERLRLLERAIAASNNSIIISDAQAPDNPIIYVNSGFERMTGYQTEEVLGKKYCSLKQTNTTPTVVEQVQRALTCGRDTQLTLHSARKDGTLFWSELCITPVRDAAGRLTNFIGVQTDITERKRTEQERIELIASLQKSEASLAEAQRIGHIGSWEFDLFTQKITWSEEKFRIFGLEPSELEPTYAQLVEMVHPDDKGRFVQTLEQAIANKTSFELDFQIVRKDGQFRYVSTRGETVANAQGQVTKLIGTVLDITELKQTEEALLESAKREHAIAKVLQSMRQTLDIDTIFRATTEELREIIECDRVAVYRFNPDWSGEFVAESVAAGWVSLVREQKRNPQLADGFVDSEECVIKTLDVENVPVRDTYLQDTQGGAYSRGASYRVTEDIYATGFNSCYLNLLKQFQARAYIIAPIFCGNQLWGLLATYQNSGSRSWSTAEINIVVQIGTQLGVALQQAELLKETQRQATQLKEAKEIADAANRAKSIFLANMSHELRTPLNAILGFTQLMSRDVSLCNQQQENLGIIMRSGEHLLELINDILEMSKIEAGRITFNESRFDLYRLLNNLQEMFQLKAASSSLELILERSPDVPQYVQTDEGKLRQVLINLLSNAIKFTQSGSVTLRVVRKKLQVESFQELKVGRLKVESSKDNLPPSNLQPTTLHFEVEDTGPGIAPEELGYLFEAFTQTATGRKSTGGTGLGLPISRSFVQLMGGELTVSSTLGRGATFQFDVPVKTAQASDIQVANANGRVMGLVPNQNEYRLLVVEDRWESRQLLVKLLTAVGFSIREAQNGEEAVALWSTWEPHLILMDMRMPVMDGYQATKQIKSHEKGQKTVIIAVTASAFEEQRAAILSVGCDDFIGKPFQEKILLEKIAFHLGVDYVCEGSPQPSFQARTRVEILSPEALAVMPRQWLEQLHWAAQACLDQEIFTLIEQIPEQHAALKLALADLIDNFRLDVIIDLTKGG